jgi:hypothetical protein
VHKEKTKVGLKARQRPVRGLSKRLDAALVVDEFGSAGGHTRRQQRINACLNLGQGPNLSGIAGITDIMSEFTDQPIESTDGELRLNAVVLVRPLSNRGAKSGEEGKDDCYEEETCASRIHKG